jgi:Spy/CpxP family protein refolding chaperone
MKPHIRAMLNALLLILIPAVAAAQAPPDDPLHGYLFPPELIMQNQEALKLSDEQKTFLKTEMRQAQQRFTELQWKLDDETERLAALIKLPQVDEQQTLAQLDKVLAAERDLKRTQIGLLVRIKNHLRADQQSILRDLRKKAG